MNFQPLCCEARACAHPPIALHSPCLCFATWQSTGSPLDLQARRPQRRACSFPGRDVRSGQTGTPAASIAASMTASAPAHPIARAAPMFAAISRGLMLPIGHLTCVPLGPPPSL